MTQSTKPISPLRQRMLEDMAMRKLGPKTQKDYIRAVVQFTRYLKRAPDTASAEDLRGFQLNLANQAYPAVPSMPASRGSSFSSIRR